MMNFAILLLLSKWSNACLTTPDMDLPPVQPTTEPATYGFSKFCLSTMNVEWAYNSIWSSKFNKNRYRYDGIHSFDNDDLHNTWLHVVNTDYNDHIDTYNHVHVHVHIDVHINVHINVYNNYVQYHNNNYNNRLLRRFSSIS
ncbi:hypothetical protein WR25_17997 [Diploscapter pachys]|uniref:Uncharacterized protein n=1 Tax=Diploscapter pachys TaxID=2018661 RepID=A0A2A2JG64_9BILA|nr:hypothetical protein WR25_17997 [Diploscapter pachys]